MENKDNNIKLNNISESELEGVKQFIKTQLDEMVLPYIYEKKLMLLDNNNKIHIEPEPALSDGYVWIWCEGAKVYTKKYE